MFNPVQIKHECMGIEDINFGDKVNTSNNSKYPTFIEEDVDYKYNEISHFWSHAQLSNEIHPKNEIHGQYNLFQSEVSFIISINVFIDLFSKPWNLYNILLRN